MIETIMRLRTIDKINVKGKRVLVRVDFNVAMEDGMIEDDFRIKKAIPTLRLLVRKKAKIILITHFGRPPAGTTNTKARAAFSVRKLARRLAKDIKRPVHFVSESIGPLPHAVVAKMKPGEIVMLENVRFHKGEEQNDEEFARGLASLGDIYVNEAFSVSHRAHASIEMITRFLPSYAGLLLAKEVAVLHRAYMRPKAPLVLAMGGAKIETKIKLIERFFDKADNILLGGMIANHVLQAQGIAVGKSKLNSEIVEKLKKVNWMSTKIHLPVDVVVAKKISVDAISKTVGVGRVAENEFILDIGPDTSALFDHIVANARMIIWNGPLGLSELAPFAAGTEEFARTVAKSKAFTIVGGGDSAASIDKLGLSKKIDFISTGGGAMLEFLAGEPMPGIEALQRKK
ncbi:MAG: phosphoglycerate kinase [Candidatus Azambacteria bacterium]|nr:phosphoglycerate kinase [Candidatus Azambacteria bacterium]